MIIMGDKEDQATLGADLAYINSTLTQHFSDTRHHVTNPAYKSQALQFIYDEFQKHGLDTNYHNFTFLGVSYTNVIGVLKGERFGTYDDKLVGVGAHYDTVKITKGVDDNGSGVTAMLESLRQIAAGIQGGKRRKNTIIFMAFDHEEYDDQYYGLIGSRFAIDQWLLPWLTRSYGQHLESLKPSGIIVLDTVMNYNSSTLSQVFPTEAEQIFLQYFPKTVASIASDQFKGDFLATIFRENLDGNLASTFNSEWLGEPQPQFEIEKFEIAIDADLNMFSDLLRSDHVNFWNTSIPAIFITDSANFRGQMQQCYHNACDNLANILTDNNVQFLGKTADTIAATLDKLSEAYTTGTSGASSVGDLISALWLSIGLMLIIP
ncbi:aminopeptidase S-like isoform X2 [Mya arenaria]|uniref:aminopeptidase S-like isoform X2 n=1 Tax=Mya arenaria TaxID=6604 RepID=UPI0022E4A51E|nr:aminopeptidase S-like isoform X2 [Mya arenaria]